MPLTPAQIRAARALLHWNQDQLQKATELSFGTIKRAEVGQKILPAHDRVIRGALEAAGVVFVDGVDDLAGLASPHGVLLKEPPPPEPDYKGKPRRKRKREPGDPSEPGSEPPPR